MTSKSDASLDAIFAQLRKTPEGQKLTEHTFSAVVDLVKKMVRIHEEGGVDISQLAKAVQDLDASEDKDDREKGIEYETRPSGYEHIVKYEGFSIAGDKHAYKCKKCGAIFQSKSKDERSIWPTDDPRCGPCDDAKHTDDDIELVCRCKPLVFGY